MISGRKLLWAEETGHTQQQVYTVAHLISLLYMPLMMLAEVKVVMLWRPRQMVQVCRFTQMLHGSVQEILVFITA